MMIDFLKETFENNFEEFKMATGRTITPAMKEYAWQQVQLYWGKLSDVANKITETEVHLILPGQVTPNNRKYIIEGIVDIIQEEDETVMYDIKTHREDEVRHNPDNYKDQLNVYAYIWQSLRGGTVDKMAIIATAPPDEIRKALKDGGRIENILEQLDKWDPIIELPFDQAKVLECIESFNETVDKIEEGKFDPPTLEKLEAIKKGQKAPFGTAVCRHCDARKSCDVYQSYRQRKKITLIPEVVREIELEKEIEKEAMCKTLYE